MFPHCMLMGLFLQRLSWILTGKIAKHKNACILKTCEIERFRQNFLSIGYLGRGVIPIFKNFLSCQNWRLF